MIGVVADATRVRIPIPTWICFHWLAMSILFQRSHCWRCRIGLLQRRHALRIPRETFLAVTSAQRDQRQYRTQGLLFRHSIVCSRAVGMISNIFVENDQELDLNNEGTAKKQVADARESGGIARWSSREKRNANLTQQISDANPKQLAT